MNRRDLMRIAGGFLAASMMETESSWAVEPWRLWQPRTRPGSPDGVPNHNYQYRKQSPTAVVVSMSAVLLPRDELPIPEPRGTSRLLSPLDSPPREPRLEERLVRYYQLDRPRVMIEQCELSDTALFINDRGDWRFSTRADQNRRVSATGVERYNPQLFVRRNEFVVRLRCLGASANALTPERAGRPVLAAIDVEAFVVENGQPRFFRDDGWSEDVKTHFAAIDRIELDFFYR